MFGSSFSFVFSLIKKVKSVLLISAVAVRIASCLPPLKKKKKKKKKREKKRGYHAQ